MSDEFEKKLTDEQNSKVIPSEEKKVDFDKLRKKQLENMMNNLEQKKNHEPIKITALNKVPKDKRYSKEAVWTCCNLNNETVSDVNGEQAHSLIIYPKNYVLVFDHIFL